MTDFKMQLPSDVQFILDRLKKCGFSAHVVGGSVRDSLIGRTLSDFDITTDATPAETKESFAGYRIIETGIKHGTVTLVLGGSQYEITTHRIDGGYRDSRHPEEVTFTTSLNEDLARRDFTVNAMAYSPDAGLTDPFGGRKDARERIIRAVGDPYVRFSEDALRILRALRFASVLGFGIEKNTAMAIRELSPSLSLISRERIYTELSKLIMGIDAIRILGEYSSVFEIILSGLSIDTLPKKELFDKADYYTRLASLFLLNSASPASSAEQALAELKTDKHTRTHTVGVLKAYGNASFGTEKDALKTLAREGREIGEGVLSLGLLTGRFSAEHSENLSLALASGIPYTVSGLAVRGGDLGSLGIRRESIGETLTELVYAVIDGRAENRKEDLIAYLEKKA